MNEALSPGPRPLPQPVAGPALWTRSVHVLLVVVDSVTVRFVFSAPFVWSDDVARALLLAVVFLGAAAALARGENAGVMFFVDRLHSRWRARVDAAAAVLILLVAVSLCWYGLILLISTAGQTVGAGV